MYLYDRIKDWNFRYVCRAIISQQWQMDNFLFAIIFVRVFFLPSSTYVPCCFFLPETFSFHVCMSKSCQLSSLTKAWFSRVCRKRGTKGQWLWFEYMSKNQDSSKILQDGLFVGVTPYSGAKVKGQFKNVTRQIFCWSYTLFRSKSKRYGRNPLIYGEKTLGRNDRGFLCCKDRLQECSRALGTTWLFWQLIF